jgi:hypothetical protein
MTRLRAAGAVLFRLAGSAVILSETLRWRYRMKIG